MTKKTLLTWKGLCVAGMAMLMTMTPITKLLEIWGRYCAYN